MQGDKFPSVFQMSILRTKLGNVKSWMKMRLEMLDKEPVAIGKLDIRLFKDTVKDEIKKGGEGVDIFHALKTSFKVEKNELFKDDEAFFNAVHAETKWGTFYKILNQFKGKRAPSHMFFDVYRVSFEGMPKLTKKSVDVNNGLFEFDHELIDEESFIIMGRNAMISKDLWIDSFIGARVYDPVNSEWDKIHIDLDLR